MHLFLYHKENDDGSSQHHRDNMFDTLQSKIDDLAEVISRFTRKGPVKKIWQAIVLVEDKTKSQDPIVRIEVQIDRTYKNHLTIQQIEVASEFQRQGWCRACMKALKEASVAVGRVAHVEQVHNEHLVTLLLSEDFYPSDDGYCFEWRPLSLQSWVVNTRSFAYYDAYGASEYQDCVKQLVETWTKAIPGMELFSQCAKWFEPETDLKKISEKLDIPIIELEMYRRDKACFGMSSLFTQVHPEYYVIEGLAVEPSLGPLALEHACICKIDKGHVYAFDLVRIKPLFIYGVVVRRDMQKKINENCKDTWAGYSVINGLNYVKCEREFWQS